MSWSGRVTLVSLNTRGVPLFGSRLAQRYAAIGTALEGGDGEVVCFQEVLTWWHLRLLARRMRSFRHVSLRPSPPGPRGGLVIFSRLAVSGTHYKSFGVPPHANGISRATRFRAGSKGALVTSVTGLSVINTHPVANTDGDWSSSNRFYPLHRAQLAVLEKIVRGTRAPVVVCGDFNVDRESTLFGGFVADTELADAFQGNCPATFRAEYLPAGAKPHCIDFILIGYGVKAEAATTVFAGKEALPGGPDYVSDHVGLRASLFNAG
jgi:endonuclease/exonuclease/phosphatase (EEP) superfamily protein YafD